jgi:predicted Holliday junction resolvase-like endonuclease
MKRGIQDRTIQEILLTLDRLVESPDDLEHWTMSIETTAKNMNKDKSDKKIEFEYYADEKLIKFFVKDAPSRDNLVKSVEMHLALIPEALQGFFTIFKYNLKNVEFN